jgi:YHS domain-containing protein
MKYAAILIALITISIMACSGTQKQTQAPASTPPQAVATLADHPVTAPEPQPALKPQTTCPVMGGPIDKTKFVDWNGKRIYVCCDGCIGAVKGNPEKYIKKLADMGQAVEEIAGK